MEECRNNDLHTQYEGGRQVEGRQVMKHDIETMDLDDDDDERPLHRSRSFKVTYFSTGMVHSVSG